MKKLIPAHLLLRLLLSVAFIGLMVAAVMSSDVSEAALRMVSASFLLLLYRSGPVVSTFSFIFAGLMCVTLALLWDRPDVCAAGFSILLVIYCSLMLCGPASDLTFLFSRTPLELLRDSTQSAHLCICLVLSCLSLSFSDVSPVCIVLIFLTAVEDIILMARIWTGRCLLLMCRAEDDIRKRQNSTGRAGLQFNVDSNMVALYERIQKMMETKKPYLEESFDQTEMSRMMGTNTTYISKTINACYGQNFSRYVNSFRIRYAIDIIKADSRIKFIEVAAMSGFHTQVSFDMAFRTYTGKTPTEYFRDMERTG